MLLSIKEQLCSSKAEANHENEKEGMLPPSAPQDQHYLYNVANYNFVYMTRSTCMLFAVVKSWLTRRRLTRRRFGHLKEEAIRRKQGGKWMCVCGVCVSLTQFS